MMRKFRRNSGIKSGDITGSTLTRSKLMSEYEQVNMRPTALLDIPKSLYGAPFDTNARANRDSRKIKSEIACRNKIT